MYRAVKVVQRSDFEYERTFEREFEGIQRYEQVSQDHPGLVDVLHVGRDDEAGFYYYVMELADDARGEDVEIDVETYEARTLSSEMKQRPTRSIRETVELGISLAGALGHLHQAGLTHRDVKPSNIIFVKGQPKLADVGLVAMTGQRTYVGTEGYVPPEGPGTSSADLYSLAMVLYEIHTAKDRLDFPELPTNMEIPPTVNRDEWRALNTVICRAGSPDPRKRFESAMAFAKELRGVVGVPEGYGYSGSSNPGGKVAALGLGTLFLILICAVGAIGWWLYQDHQKFQGEVADRLASNEKEKASDVPEILVSDGDNKPVAEGEGKAESSFTIVESKGEQIELDEVIIEDPKMEGSDDADDQDSIAEPTDPEEETKPIIAEVVEPAKQTGQVKVMSDPSGATLWIDGEEVGLTETRLMEFETGPIELTLRKQGYHDREFRGEIREGTQVINLELLPDLSPIPGNPWVNSLGMEFEPRPTGSYRSKQPAPVDTFDIFLAETGLEIPRTGFQGNVQLKDDAVIQRFTKWLTALDQSRGFLGSRQYYSFERDPVAPGRDSFYLVIDDRFGILILNSEPSGAQIFEGDNYLGTTPSTINDLPIGPFSVSVVLPGYQVEVVEGELSEEPVARTISLERDGSVLFGENWRNSQGMEMIPMGDLMIAKTEATVRNFREFVTESRGFSPNVDFPQSLDHPVAGVNLGEAKAFCAWLTNRERSLGMIRPWQSYRLPTDGEWSRLAGLAEESGSTPADYSNSQPAILPWSGGWPPEEKVGNFADEAAAGIFGRYIIERYNDGFPNTSPVGSFRPNEFGLLDVSGNVWEWVLDSYDGVNDQLHTMRGGGWNSYEEETLNLRYRNAVPASSREGFYGFRYVLEDSGVPNEG